MRAYLPTLNVIAQMAIRNLFASRVKTLIVGGIIFFGAFLVVVGTGLLDSLDRAMKRSIIGSVAGDIQIYSSESKEELDVMGGFSLEGSDIAPIEQFERVAAVIERVPNVKAVVPMGISGALVSGGNTIDVTLAELRDSVRKKQEGQLTPELAASYESQKAHVRQIVRVLQNDIKNVGELNDERVIGPEELAAIERSASEEFWRDFERDPLDALEFLENRVAPLAADADLLGIRYVGTDPALFAKTFDRLRIVDGQAIPPGQRGFLFSKFVYEDQIKLKTARNLDKIKEGRDERQLRIETDLDLQRMVRENASQVKELLLQLDDRKTALFRSKLQPYLSSQENDVGKLLSSFLTVNDQNFDERYRFFYDQLAPSLALYRVPVGSTITIKAFTRSGYVQSVNLRVYGTFAFAGLEKSPQAGYINMMDLVSFRELYGFVTAERAREIAALKAAAGAKEVRRENAEAELFGEAPDAESAEFAAAPTGGAEPEGTSPGAPAAPSAGQGILAPSGKVDRADRVDQRYDPRQLQQGVFLNAAVMLHDQSRLEETRAAIEEAAKQNKLPLRAVSWSKASGLTGQFATLMRIVLFTAVLIIFVVALVIINNALVMATLERVREIGTLRALGAQRTFVLAMLITESVVVGSLFGAIGAGTGALLITWLGRVGIPAANDVFMFFFSGPRLFPELGAGNLVGALTIVLLVSIASSFYPAFIAMRITPRQAMQTED